MAVFDQACLYDIIKSKALDFGYIFIAGSGQWTNLSSVTQSEDQIYLIYEQEYCYFLKNEFGAVEGYGFNGQFYLCKHDTINNDYQEKYETIIKPLTGLLEDFCVTLFGKCSTQFSLKNGKILELVNYLDCNFTGSGLDFNIEWIR